MRPKCVSADAVWPRCRVEHFIPVKAWTAGVMAQAYECFGFPAAVLYLQVVLIYAVMDSDGD